MEWVRRKLGGSEHVELSSIEHIDGGDIIAEFKSDKCDVSLQELIAGESNIVIVDLQICSCEGLNVKQSIVRNKCLGYEHMC